MSLHTSFPVILGRCRSSITIAAGPVLNASRPATPSEAISTVKPSADFEARYRGFDEIEKANPDVFNVFLQ